MEDHKDLSALFRLIEIGNGESIGEKLSQLREFLISGGDLNAKNSVGDPALIVIATQYQDIVKAHGHGDGTFFSDISTIITWLVENGCEIDATDSGGLTPLMQVAPFRDSRLVSLFLSLRANVLKTCFAGRTALMYATRSSEYTCETVSILIKAGVAVNARDLGGRQAIHFALEQNGVDTIEMLVEGGADITVAEVFLKEFYLWRLSYYLPSFGWPMDSWRRDEYALPALNKLKFYGFKFDEQESQLLALILARCLIIGDLTVAKQIFLFVFDFRVEESMCMPTTSEDWGRRFLQKWGLSFNTWGIPLGTELLKDNVKRMISEGPFLELLKQQIIIPFKIYYVSSKGLKIDWDDALERLFYSLKRLALNSRETLEEKICFISPVNQKRFERILRQDQTKIDFASEDLLPESLRPDQRPKQKTAYRRKSPMPANRLAQLSSAISDTETRLSESRNAKVGLASDSSPSESGPPISASMSSTENFLAVSEFSRLRTLPPEFGFMLPELLRNPITSLRQFIVPALGPFNSARRIAEIAIRYLAAHGHESSIREFCSHLGDDVIAHIENTLSRDHALDYAKSSNPKLPWFWGAEFFPAVFLKGTRLALPLGAIDQLAILMAVSGSVVQSPELRQVIDACDRESLASFSWSMFEEWETKGDMNNVWMFDAMAYLGDNDCARRLARKIRDWPRTQNKSRAYRGLAILASMGTDFALRELYSLCIKNRHESVRMLAQELIELVASRRNLSPLELEDRLIPDIGLTGPGKMELDLGSRKIFAIVGVTLGPKLTEANGNELAKFPSVRRTDDKELVRLARKKWSDFCKTLRTAGPHQLDRLEHAMISQRRWSVVDFREFLVQSRFLHHAVRALVWTQVSITDSMPVSFRVLEDGCFESIDSELIVLRDDCVVSIVHPVVLDQPVLDAWRRVFSANQISQPFLQLARKTYRSCEDLDDDLFGLQGSVINSKTLYGLKDQGWRLSGDSYGGHFSALSKAFGATEVTINLEDSFLHATGHSEKEEARINVSIFSRDDHLGFSEGVREVMNLRM